jgi:prolipoprotein diacylglyceryltransferase
MHELIYDDGFFAIPTWHFVFITATIVATFYYLRLLLKLNCKINKHSALLPILVYFSGYLGAKAGSDFSLLFPSAMSFYPGAGCAAFCYFCYYKIFNLEIKQLDCLAPALLLAYGLGRVGCFFNHDDYGIVNHLFASDIFPKVPVQLIESLIISLSALIIPWKTKTNYPGKIAIICVLTQSLVRIACEFIRDDPRVFIFKNYISLQQVCAASTAILALWVLQKSALNNSTPSIQQKHSLLIKN